MTTDVRRRRVALALTGLLIIAGLGAVTHAVDHGGQPTDAVCSFCVSAAHGKAPPPAIPIEPQAAASIVPPSVKSVLSRSSQSVRVPPARAPPSEVAA